MTKCQYIHGNGEYWNNTKTSINISKFTLSMIVNINKFKIQHIFNFLFLGGNIVIDLIVILKFENIKII